jgi:hypothetical protein
VKREDFEQAPCACGACVQAGVSERPQKRDPKSGAWMHGYQLKCWYEAQDAFWQRFKEGVEKRTMSRPVKKGFQRWNG